MEFQKITVKLNDKLERIDQYLTKRLNFSRSHIKNLIEKKLVLVNDNETKANYIVKIGDKIIVYEEKKPEHNLNPVNLNLEVVYEDDYLAVINKPKNLIVHASDTFYGITLVNGLMYEFEKLSNEAEPLRRGIVHRLDKDTSGLLIIAKDDKTHLKLKKMFQKRNIKKEYLAICYRPFKEFKGTINKPIKRHPKKRQKMAVFKTGRSAITHYEVLAQNDSYSLVKLDLVTGRTHQIRVHLKSIHHPILGDEVYGPRKVYKNNGPYLHAYKLEFNHPITKKRLSLEAKPPKVFLDELNFLQLHV